MLTSLVLFYVWGWTNVHHRRFYVHILTITVTLMLTLAIMLTIPDPQTENSLEKILLWVAVFTETYRDTMLIYRV